MPSPQPSYSRAINIPSSRTSPSASHFGNPSLEPTPEGAMAPMCSSSLPAVPSYLLPDALLPPPLISQPPTSTPSAMVEALSKGPGLIRRVSRGAQGIPSKFRRNGSNAQRDKSSGPVIMRRRSDSRSAVDAAHDLSDFEAYSFQDEIAVDEDGEHIDPLGMMLKKPLVSSIPSVTVEAPTRNLRLEQGTVLKKITKGPVKDITLRLDVDSAKVYWDPNRPSKSFYIDDVKEIRTGADAKHYREELGYTEAYEPFWMTVVYSDTSRSKGKSKTMHLIAPNVGIFRMWTQTLDSVSRDRIDMMAGLMSLNEKSAKLVWQRQMKQRFRGQVHLEEQESLDLAGIMELCRSLHINSSEDKVRAYFDKADTARTGRLNQAQFLFFVRRLKERKDVKQIYKLFTPAPHTGMDKQTFFAFLQREQGIDVDADIHHWTATFEKFARAGKPKATPPEGGEIPLPLTMTSFAFQAFLVSDTHNSIYNPISSSLKLDRPLGEYFISSSHNTYLMGRQVADESSTEAYITALQKGCRCLEIDCWDGNDGKPIVTHGRTFTKSITFLDVIKVIDKYAFTESEYPLILSLEVHCGPEQQALMAKIMIEEFGSKLLVQPLDGGKLILPSPEELKHRILIKVKAPAEELDAKALASELTYRRRERSLSSPWSRPIDSIIPNTPPVSSPTSISPPERTNYFWSTPLGSGGSATTTALLTPAGSADDSDSPNGAEELKKKSKKSKTSHIVKKLGDLGVYTRGMKFDDFSTSDSKTYNHVFSLNERTFDKTTKNGELKHSLEAHNMNCLMRVYPSGHRINSSNFDPLKSWRRGVQMAALNWQTYDLGQQLNEAMFAGGNDRTGYVLKPEEMRPQNPISVPSLRKLPKKEVKFTVQIISAQQLPRPEGLSKDAGLSPVVQFEMYCAEDTGPNATGIGGQDVSARKDGFSGIGHPLRKRTRIAQGNGYNPEFKDEIEMTVTTKYPDLVFVRWTVWNTVDGKIQENAPIAQFTAKLNSIQQGYRHLPLFDGNGEQYLFSRLFCKIKKQDIVDAPMAPLQHIGSRRPSTEPNGTLQDNAGKGSFIKRLMRAPSERKKRKEERTMGDMEKWEGELASRTSNLERSIDDNTKSSSMTPRAKLTTNNK
ncbi:PLC-like phosphodiesterase [Periconia macrospinosa]|uniref:Phosphoinositide phospholipase C n=1 Tax=Periconia macrospinosa TaxID=97972 RepID=A0A2V1E508_9PLEO|nr:PLC-like phosphodiesterase [Periconia macrospinosa]